MGAPTLVAVKTVIVADDTAFVRDRFKGALEQAGHRAVPVRTGPELMAALRQSHVDLIVLDLHLPQANGLDLLRSIRRLDERNPAVVVFSGTIASADEVRHLKALGVSGYVNEYTAVQHIVPSLAPHLFPEYYNRRSSPRVVLGIPVTYRFGNTIATALLLNISHGGVAIRTTTPLEAGATVRVRFRLPARKRDIDVEARTSWADQRVGMGLQFATIDAESQTAIDEFVQSHFFSNRKA